jgi:hypothetical protein
MAGKDMYVPCPPTEPTKRVRTRRTGPQPVPSSSLGRVVVGAWHGRLTNLNGAIYDGRV